MADDFSVRARKARVAQGLTEVLSDSMALDRLSGLMALSSAHQDASRS